ncbi:hypothetical protein VTN96DRAFT_5046 [Rasamsonia emersonii]
MKGISTWDVSTSRRLESPLAVFHRQGKRSGRRGQGTGSTDTVMSRRSLAHGSGSPLAHAAQSSQLLLPSWTASLGRPASILQIPNPDVPRYDWANVESLKIFHDYARALDAKTGRSPGCTAGWFLLLDLQAWLICL